MHRFRIHGLDVAAVPELIDPSELVPIPAQTSRSKLADPTVVVELGEVPHELEPPFVVHEDYLIKQTEILLTVPRVGRFWAVSGSKLTVQPAKNADPLAVRLYLLGSAFAAIIHQRGLWPLHACAIDYEDRCIAFVGVSGAGKSTLAAQLSQMGFPLLSDDVLVLDEHEAGKFRTNPSLPTVKLAPESIESVRFHGGEGFLEMLRSHKLRFIAPERFRSSRLPVDRIYALSWKTPMSAEPSFKKLSGFEAVLELGNNIYQPELVNKLDRKADFLSFAGKFLTDTKFYQFARPLNLATIEDSARTLIEHFKSD